MSTNQPPKAAKRGHWTVELRQRGRFSCHGCGASVGEHLAITGERSIFDACPSCAAELRDLFLDITEQRT